jgi:hypothetical protein
MTSKKTIYQLQTLLYTHRVTPPGEILFRIALGTPLLKFSHKILSPNYDLQEIKMPQKAQILDRHLQSLVMEGYLDDSVLTR